MTRLSYSAEAVRRHDNDRYLSALFAPADRREALFALYAFNLEVAKTREAVSEPMLGQIRLQWWREALDGIYDGAPRRHQVVEALAEAVAGFGLSRGHFHRLIAGREFDLEERPPADLGELTEYAEATSSSLVALALEILGAGGEAAAGAGRHVGLAWSLTGLLRAAPFHARAGRLYLPGSMMTAAGAAPADYFALRPSPALAAVAREVADAARGHLREARAPAPEVPRAALPALLPAVLAEGWLGRLARARYDVFDPRLARPMGRRLRLWRAARRGRY